MATKEIILCEPVHGVGAEADIVRVKAGFANNYLVPQGKALEANKHNKAQIETLKQARAEREAAELKQINATASKIAKLGTLKFELEAGEGDKAFGSITTIDIAKRLEESGLTVDRHSIQLDKAIKTSGEQTLEVKLNADVVATLKIEVVFITK